MTWTMFYASHVASISQDKYVWFVDNACNNHTTSKESLLINLDRNVTYKVEMGTCDLVQAIGKRHTHSRNKAQQEIHKGSVISSRTR